MRRALYGVPLKKRAAEGRALNLTKKSADSSALFCELLKLLVVHHVDPFGKEFLLFGNGFRLFSAV